MLNSTRLFVWLCCVTSLFFIKAEENFELWNRTSQTVYFTFKLEIVTKLAGETKVEYVTYELSPLGKDVAVHATLTQPITLYITKEQPKEPGGSVVALEAQINPNTGKTFYLEIIPVEGSTFALRPQPKPTTLFGFTVSGATESKLGHSLSNNATDKDIIIQKATYTKPNQDYKCR
jgi:hypothetical protein